MTTTTRITLCIAATLQLFIAGCSSGKNAKLPSMSDYSGVSAKQHYQNVNQFFQRPEGYEWKAAPPKILN